MGYSKVRSLVTGNTGLDTFIREVRTSLGELQGTTESSTTGPLTWDSNHQLAFSFSQTDTKTLRNEGSAGESYTLTLGGNAVPRLGFPAPFGTGLEFASETTATSFAYGAGAFPIKANNYSVEWMFYTHFAPYDMTGWNGVAFEGYVCLWKEQSFYSTIPALVNNPPATIYAAINSPANVIVGTYPTRPFQIPTGQWNHAMFTASATDGKRLYLNGAMVASTTNTTATMVTTKDWYFGGASGNLYKFYGAIARFAYSSVVRPQSYAIAVTKAMRGW